MLEDEEENVAQLEILVARFYRPFKMAASSKKPPCTHEDVSSIFLNCETILFLHQIFYKGLQARMNSWPTLVLGKAVPISIFYFGFVGYLIIPFTSWQAISSTSYCPC
jgi:RhoGEF domain